MSDAQQERLIPFQSFLLRDPPASPQPVAPQIIDDEQDRRRRPCQRIAERHRGDLRTHGHDHQIPDHAQDTDADTGHQHRRNGIAASARRAAQDLDTDIGDIAGRDHAHHAEPDRDHIRVIREQMQENAPARKHDNTQQNAGKRRHTQTDAHTFPDPVILARAEVLPRKGSDRYAVSAHDHPENTVHFAVCRPRRDRIRAKRIDTRLDDQVGGGIHSRLDPRRQTDADDIVQEHRMKPDLAKDEPVGLVCPHQRYHHHERADHLRQRRRHCHADHTHFQYRHEENIQHDIDQTGQYQKIQRSPGIPHSSQDPRTHIVYEGRDDAEEIDPHVHG